MELNLVPSKPDTTLTDGDGGAYYAWTPASSPVLATMLLGAGKLILRPCGFAFPHYSDSKKIGYAMQGKCTVGFVFPNSPQEKIMTLEQGNAVAVSEGTTSWWFNAGDSDVVIIFLGVSTESYTPGIFNYFLLTGAIGVLNGFSTDFISKIYDLNDVDSEKLVKSQKSPLIIKLGEEINMPHNPNHSTQKEYVFNVASAHEEITGQKYPSLDKIGLSAGLGWIGPGLVTHPTYSADASHRIIYVTKGNGRVQIVGLNGGQVLDGNVEEGDLFVVPKFFPYAILGGENGLEFFYVTTSARPMWGYLSGKASAWKALSDPVLEASLNVSPQFVRTFKSNN